MFSSNFIYPLPRHLALSAHINSDHDHIPGTSLIIKKINKVELTIKFSFGAMPSPNIPGLAIVPPLSSVVIHGLLLF